MGSYRSGYPTEVVVGESPGRGIEAQEVGDLQEAWMVQMPVPSRRSPEAKRALRFASDQHWIGRSQGHHAIACCPLPTGAISCAVGRKSLETLA
jgi:hypothetical protein